MQRHSSPRNRPSWTTPGARWRTRLYWPMLCIALGFLAWRVTEGASRASIVLPSCHVLVWACLLLALVRSAQTLTGLTGVAPGAGSASGTVGAGAAPAAGTRTSGVGSDSAPTPRPRPSLLGPKARWPHRAAGPAPWARSAPIGWNAVEANHGAASQEVPGAQRTERHPPCAARRVSGMRSVPLALPLRGSATPVRSTGVRLLIAQR